MRGGLTVRLAVISVLFTVMISTAFAAILISVYELSSSVTVATNAEQAVSASNTLERLVLDVEAGRRGYALTHDQALLEPWIQAQQQIPLRQQDLASSVASDRAQAARVTRLNNDVTAYIDNYADPAIADDEAGEPANIDPQSIRAGQKHIAALRAEFDEFITAQRTRVDRLHGEADRAGQQALAASIAGFAVALTAVALLMRSLNVMVVRPLHRMVLAADRVAGGDLTARVPTAGPAEVGVLQRTFNAMVAALDRGRVMLAAVAAEQAALRRVATVAARGKPAEEVFAAVTEEAGKLFGADAAVLLRFDPDGDGTVVASWSQDPTHRISLGKVKLAHEGIAGQVLRSGRPIRLAGSRSADFLQQEFGDTSIRSAIGAPVLVAGRTWGALKALSTCAQPLEQHDAERAAEFTELVASAIANSQARADLTASRARVVAATDESRRRIERDLHDGTQQRLIALLLALRATEPQAGDGLQDRIHTIGSDLSAAIDELRELARGIHPSILSEGGLTPAIKSLARRSPVPVELHLRLPERLNTNVEIGVYYVVAEALTNAIRHAHGTVISVSGEIVDDHLNLSVEDDGVGGADPGTGTGLTGLGDRVAALGGTMQIASRSGAGTRLSITVPLTPTSTEPESPVTGPVPGPRPPTTASSPPSATL
ncbi:CHASE3 domain-containing protein [Dactylosporangium sp. CA-233914]|uniref:CHASE3 domain-containing protein n=1 Tax=Dactylosporangium sp. CA-233914 TaxID=3239934 RepID=UPI003D925A61